MGATLQDLYREARRHEDNAILMLEMQARKLQRVNPRSGKASLMLKVASHARYWAKLNDAEFSTRAHPAKKEGLIEATLRSIENIERNYLQ